MSLANSNAHTFYSVLHGNADAPHAVLTNKDIVDAKMTSNPLIAAMGSGFNEFREQQHAVLGVKKVAARPMNKSDADALRRYAQFTKNMEKMSIPLADPSAGPTAELIRSSARNPFLHKQISLRGLVRSRQGVDAIRHVRKTPAPMGGLVNNVTAKINLRSLKALE